MGKLLDVVMPWSFDEICGLSKAFNTSRENFLPIDIAFVLLLLDVLWMSATATAAKAFDYKSAMGYCSCKNVW